MSDVEFKAVALAIIGLMAVIAIYPIFAEQRRVIEPFSELGLLGPNMKLGDYPTELTIGQNFNLYLYVGNHEGGVRYFRVLAKLGGLSSSVSDSSALDAPILASWDCILPNEGNSTTPIILSIPTAGLYQRLVFELYQYEPANGNFAYNQRWTQLWLNVNKSVG